MEELSFFTSLMDRGIWKAEGTRLEWTLKFETPVIIWLVLGLCRYTWAINQSENILNKMTTVVRVNLMQELLTELPHQYFIAAYYCSPGTPRPLVAENKSACMNSKLSRGWLLHPNSSDALWIHYNINSGIFLGASVATKCDYVCENNSASLMLPLHFGKRAMY